MKFGEAIDAYVFDMRAAGRINSDRTERSYRSILQQHLDDVDNRDPRTIGREDVKRSLRRWPNANTQRTNRSILVSFYRWTVEEGMRPYNPAEQTRRPKKQQTSVYRLTLEEVQAFLAATENTVEWRATRLGVCAGIRNAELRGLQGRHFRRPGFVWVSQDIGKGSRERWIPVIADLIPVWDDIHRHVADDEYVLPAQRWRNPGLNTERKELAKRPMSAQGVYYLVGRVAKRAGIQAHVHPHLMRHAFGDHIAKRAGLLIAQAMLGHADVSTTRSTYVGAVSLDDLTAAVIDLSFDMHSLPLGETPSETDKAPTGIEPVDSASRASERLGAALMGLRANFKPLAEEWAA
jgi:site-specific recombinase XerD